MNWSNNAKQFKNDVVEYINDVTVIEIGEKADSCKKTKFTVLLPLVF